MEELKSRIANSSLHSAERAFILCLSFANLCFMNVWVDMQDREINFYRKFSLTWNHLTGVTLDILILTVVLWVPVCLVVRTGSRAWIRFLKWCILAGLIIPLNIIRTDQYFIERSGEIVQATLWRAVLSIIGVAFALFLVFRWEKLSTRVAATVLVILLPALPLAFARTAWAVYSGPPEGLLPNRPLVPPLPQPAGAPHVLWILFDEWDRFLTFDGRAAGLQLPELDRFRSHALDASHAYPPAQYTMISVPSLLTGRVFVKAKPLGTSDLSLTVKPGQPDETLTSQSSIFPEARSSGFNVGIVGWYMPYCRFFEGCTTCSWRLATGVEEADTRLSVARFMFVTAARQLRKVPLMLRLGIAPREDTWEEMQLASFRELKQDTLESVRDPRLNLLFVHLNVPHPPAIYDPGRGTLLTSQDHTYLDNVVLLDRTLGEIRLTLEKAGMWDDSTILLTSDHPLRIGLARDRPRPTWERALQGVKQSGEVPFLLKMAGQQQGFAYDAAMQTIVTKDLLLAIMKSEVRQPEQVALWLDHHVRPLPNGRGSDKKSRSVNETIRAATVRERLPPR